MILHRWLALSAVLAGVGCDPFHATFDDEELAILYRAAEPEPGASNPVELVVMTYNVKFGGGRADFFFDCHGDRVLMTEREVLDNLRALAGKIAAVDPDVLLLQEVDVASKRSAFVDQLQWLLDHTRLSFGAYASQWRADFVPSDGLGPVDSGNAVLSRYPIVHAKRIALPLRSDQSAVERYFYLRRNILHARIDVGGDVLDVLDLHAEAYAKDGTKLAHIERFAAELEALSDRGDLFLAGGDLNTLPPQTEKLVGFPDSVCEDEDFQADDFREETDYLDGLYEAYAEAIPLDDYAADNEPYFSHTTDASGFWNRRLDYLFTNGEFVPGSGLVHQDEASGGTATMPLSDHAPVSAVLALP
ncbi:MAG TPA: endonuclease/exonuclease/phosphatase family protein [Polyangiaceae bacterium]|jgi:endonuclease/exonuclease/phosphatase family metal-dependent hydrolase